jgi:hypothetical protein
VAQDDSWARVVAGVMETMVVAVARVDDNGRRRQQER